MFHLFVDIIIWMLLQLQHCTRKSKMFKLHENRLIVVVNVNLLIVKLILMLFFSVKKGINS